MRSHRSYPLFDLWRDPELLRRMVTADALAAARVEPMMRQANGFGVVDLTFVREGEIAVVPFVQVEGSMLAEPERSPFVWPRSVAAAVDPAATDAVEAAILPWLLAHFLGRRLNREQVRIFGTPGGPFERARAVGFLGAAPYARVAEAAAPYVYALRLARGARVAVTDDPIGATGAAMLADVASEVAVDFGSSDADAFARSWFAGRFATGARSGPFGVAIGPPGADLPEAPVSLTLHDDVADAVPVARAIASDVLFSFDPEDSEKAGAFSVRAPELTLRRAIGSAVPMPVGGSTGRLLFVLRNDAARADDADSDDALALAMRLRGEGFDVDIRPAAAAGGDLSGYDLVHAFTLSAASEMTAVLSRAREAGIPTVATANLDDIVREGVWGAGISSGVHMVTTDDEVAVHLIAIERRALESENLNPKGQEPFAGYEAAVGSAAALCDAILAGGPAEERLLRERFAYGGPVIPVGPSLAPRDPRAEAGLGALVGEGDFVLAHAPIAARSNLVALARAAMEAGLPLVIAGPVVETGYAALLRELGDGRVALLTTAAPDAVAALYRRARVYADVAWEDRGAARSAAAALGGASLVLAQSHYAVELWRPGLWSVDRASTSAIVEGLRGAWDGAGGKPAAECAARVAVYCDPVMSLAGVAGAYAQAQSIRAGT